MIDLPEDRPNQLAAPGEAPHVVPGAGVAAPVPDAGAQVSASAGLRNGSGWDSGRLTAFVIVSLFVTHAIAYFLHEYSHSFVAWFLGGKDNPLKITYGHLNLSNLLLQQEVDENVDYASLFGQGRFRDVAVIALSGPGIGNGVLYVLLALVLRFAKSVRRSSAATLFVTLLALMAAANLWSYAPVRTIATHGDMGNASEGLRITSWQLFPIVVIPSVLVGVHFFRFVLPAVLRRIFGDDVRSSSFLIAVVCAVYFVFYGAAPSIGGNYGNASAVFATLSMFVFMPLVVSALLKCPLRQGAPTA